MTEFLVEVLITIFLVIIVNKLSDPFWSIVIAALTLVFSPKKFFRDHFSNGNSKLTFSDKFYQKTLSKN